MSCRYDEARLQKFAALYNAGKSYKEIAKVFGLSVGGSVSYLKVHAAIRGLVKPRRQDYRNGGFCECGRLKKTRADMCDRCWNLDFASSSKVGRFTGRRSAQKILGEPA